MSAREIVKYRFRPRLPFVTLMALQLSGDLGTNKHYQSRQMEFAKFPLNGFPESDRKLYCAGAQLRTKVHM